MIGILTNAELRGCSSWRAATRRTEGLGAGRCFFGLIAGQYWVDRSDISISGSLISNCRRGGVMCFRVEVDGPGNSS